MNKINSKQKNGKQTTLRTVRCEKEEATGATTPVSYQPVNDSEQTPTEKCAVVWYFHAVTVQAMACIGISPHNSTPPLLPQQLHQYPTFLCNWNANTLTPQSQGNKNSAPPTNTCLLQTSVGLIRATCLPKQPLFSPN